LPRVALIGVSGYARAYLEWVENALDQNRFQFVAVVVVNRAEEAAVCQRLEARGVPIYDNWPAMLEAWRGRLDLCLAPLPIHLHAEVAVAALEAGANVLLEKPVAATLAQVERIQEAERRTGRWVAVGFQDYYTKGTRRIADDLAAGRLGRVRSIRWLGLWPRSEAYYRRTSWAGRVCLDGQMVRDSPLNNAMAHYLNLAFYWAWAGTGQKPEIVGTEAELFRTYPIESFDTGVVRMRTQTGVILHASVTHCCPSEKPIFLQILGDEGELRWVHRDEACWIAGGTETGRLPVECKAAALDAMFDAVLTRLRNPDTRVCSVQQAQLQVAAIESLPSGIRSIEPGFCHVVPASGETRLVIENVARDLEACMTREALPSEIGAAWAGRHVLASA
jgi:predicted dehydrogenase